MRATKFSNGAIVVHLYEPEQLMEFYRLVFAENKPVKPSAIATRIPTGTAARLYTYYLDHGAVPPCVEWTRVAKVSDKEYQAHVNRRLFPNRNLRDPEPEVVVEKESKEETWDRVVPRLLRRGGRLERRGTYTFVIMPNGDEYLVPRQVLRRLAA
jgi:hypothetical protein